MDYVTRGVCGQEGCRERRYYLDNGLWYCRRGHLQEGVQVADDDNDFGNLGKVHRVRKEIKEKTSKTLRGRPAWTLFLQTYQLILWKQSYALVHEKGFPEELEIVVRDLWALRLQDYKLKITSATDDTDGDTEPEVFSSQPGEQDESGLGFKPNSRYLQWPRLLDSVALCYLAALLMRLPVCVNDFYDMIVRQEIPYARVLASVPLEMRERLPPELTGILEANKIPKPEHLHHGVQSLALFYQRRFEVALPPLNSPILIFRHIKRLALPIEIYDVVKTLQDLLGVTFQYPKPKAAIERKKSHFLPDVQLVVLITIATKLIFPFDDLKRYPTNNKEPAAQIMDWSQWAHAQKGFSADSHFAENIGKGTAIHVTDQDVLNMTPEQMDNYMDWYASDWLDTSRTPERIAEMFPINRVGATQPTATTAPEPSSTQDAAHDTIQEKLDMLLHKVIQDLRPRRVIPEEDHEPKRPGDMYSRYRWESQLSGAARTFYEIAAKLAAVPLKTFVRAVTLTEIHIAQIDEKRQHREYFANQGVEVIDSDDADEDYAMDEF